MSNDNNSIGGLGGNQSLGATGLGMNASCSGFFDEKTNLYNKSDTTEILKCCIDNCTEESRMCYTNCDLDNSANVENCYNKCNWGNNCISRCSAADNKRIYDDYFNCARDIGDCVGGIPDKECVIKNKEKILECCRKTCLSTQDTDCETMCDYLEYVILNKQPLKRVITRQQTLKNKTGYSFTILITFFIGFITILIIYLIFFSNK